MKEQDIIKACAELDGRMLCKDGWWDCPSRSMTGTTGGKSLEYIQANHRYTTSYDAIIPLIQKQELDTRSYVSKFIGLKYDYNAWIDATPLQLCEALLRATGKWKE